MGHEEKKQAGKQKRPKVVLLKDLASEESFDKVTGGDARRKLVFGERSFPGLHDRNTPGKED